jgi:hypothetical protein
MKNVTWIVQSNVSPEHDKWFAALTKLDSPYREIKIIPFSDELMDVQVETEFAIAHGSTTLIRNAPKKPWNPGIFFNPYNFKPSTWREKYGREFVNYNGLVGMLGHAKFMPYGDHMFIRPNGDFKDFSGSVVSKEGIEKFIEETSLGGHLFDNLLEIYMSPEIDIVEEWRIFIVDGKAVSASKYKVRTMLDKKAGAPPEVIEYANKLAQIWSPEKAYVMDICRIVGSELKLLELNCFNASGVYDAPIDPIIKAVEALYAVR